MCAELHWGKAWTGLASGAITFGLSVPASVRRESAMMVLSDVLNPHGIALQETILKKRIVERCSLQFVKRRRKCSKIAACLLCLMLQAVASTAQPVTKIAAGATHSLILKSDGSVWFTGGSTNGPLGDGTLVNTNRFEAIAISNVIAIAAGGMHNLFVKSDGSLWTMGNNYYGQLGDGTFGAVPPFGTNQPEQIVSSNVVMAAGGGFHSLFVKSNGSLWAMGYNNMGQLGDGIIQNGYKTNQPEQIVASNVTATAAGNSHSLFLKNDGSLWGMGWNMYGQLGAAFPTRTPVQIVASNVTAIAAGADHSLFIKNDGSLWAMGDNYFGQLGDGTSNGGNYSTNVPEQIVAGGVIAVSAGSHHSLFLKSDGSLWGMGNNQFGQLGDGSFSSRTSTPEQIVATNVTAIEAGAYYSLFLKSDGSLWGMGTNNFGQLGDGTYTTANRPEQILAAYNQISGQLLSGNMQFSFVGIGGANYALDRSFSLSPPNWLPQVTNAADSIGFLVFTNTPNPANNNFWRIRLLQ
jgi:alpha-tubulin suppressor-like RCC1 family protein